jgi:hypothetical protein
MDTKTGQRTSLQTNDEATARQLLEAKNQAVRRPAMNLQIAQVYLQHGDPALAARTWQHVMEQMVAARNGVTQTRWQRAIRDEAFDLIRARECGCRGEARPARESRHGGGKPVLQ